MARVLHAVEKGLRLYAENSQSDFVDVLFGAAAPDGLGDQSAAAIGSLYLRTNGSIYQKIANAGNSADWQLNGATSAVVGTWRPEAVVVVTNDTQGAGTRDVVANPFADDDGTAVPLAAYVVDKYIISDADGTPALLRISAVVGNNVTFMAASSPLVADDTFVAEYYLPDTPDNQEAQAIVNYNGSVIVKIADINWNLADGITLNGYTESQGPIVGTDTVQVAIEKSGGDITDMVALSGVARGSVNLGSFTGATIPDNQTVKQALQSLETAHEEVDQNVNDLITLSGMPENSTNFGSFTGVSLDDNQSAKQLYQRIEDLLEQLRGVQVTGITAATTVDSVPHASVKACKWLVEAFEQATPANRQALEVFALTDGTSVDNTVYAKIKVGANFNLTISVDISGADMRLRAASSTAGVTVTARRIEVVKSVL